MNISKEMVNVIVPVYNGESSLERCVNSILKQTYTNLEIIIINDGSTDSSYEIAERFSTFDKRITLINQSNQGVSAARNYGIANANGKYILFVDADDYIESNMVELLVTASEKYNAPITSCGVFIEDMSSDHSRKTSESIAFNEGITTVLSNENLKSVFPEKLITAVFHSVFAKLYRLDYIKKNNAWFDPEFSLGEDYLFNLPLFRNVDQYVYVGKALYHYVRYSSNNTLSRKYRADLFEIELKLFNSTLSMLKSWNISREHSDKYIYEVFFNNMHVILENEASPCKTSTKWKKLMRLRYIVHQKEVRDLTAQTSFRPKGYKYKFEFYLLKMRVFPLLLWVGAKSRRKNKDQ